MHLEFLYIVQVIPITVLRRCRFPHARQRAEKGCQTEKMKTEFKVRPTPSPVPFHELQTKRGEQNLNGEAFQYLASMPMQWAHQS